MVLFDAIRMRYQTTGIQIQCDTMRNGAVRCDLVRRAMCLFTAGHEAILSDKCDMPRSDLVRRISSRTCPTGEAQGSRPSESKVRAQVGLAGFVCAGTVTAFEDDTNESSLSRPVATCVWDPPNPDRSFMNTIAQDHLQSMSPTLVQSLHSVALQSGDPDPLSLGTRGLQRRVRAEATSCAIGLSAACVERRSGEGSGDGVRCRTTACSSFRPDSRGLPATAHFLNAPHCHYLYQLLGRLS